MISGFVSVKSGHKDTQLYRKNSYYAASNSRFV